MAERILKNIDQVMRYVNDVRRLADKHRQEFGFLKDVVYADHAKRGNLWVVVDTASIDFRGHLLLGGQHPRMKVFQICVQRDHRSLGIARMLISELIRYSTECGYLNITARVSSLLPANKFWQRSGFHIIKQTKEASGTTINLYSLNLDVPSLFSDDDSTSSSLDHAALQIDPRRPLLHTPSYVIDLNVFFDANGGRDHGHAAQIMALSLEHTIRLWVTPEFVKELDRASRDHKNDPVLTFAKKLPTLSHVPSDRLKSIITDLRDLLPSTPTDPRRWRKNDISDQIHLASSIYHKAFGFITRDSAILRHFKGLSDRFGLQVLSPGEVVGNFDLNDDKSIHPPTSISERGEIRAFSSIDDSISTSVDRFLRRYDTQGHDLSWWRSVITGNILPDPVVVSSAEQVVGIGLWSGLGRSRSDAVLHLLVDDFHHDADRAIDHILSVSANIGEFDRVWRFNLKIPRKQIRTRETALKRGFHPQRGIDNDDKIEFTRVVVKRAIVSGHWPRLVHRFREETGLSLAHSMPSYPELINTGIVLSRDGIRTWTMRLFDFETFLSPGLLIAPHRGAVIVPIKQVYAEELLPEASSQGLLVSQHDAAFWLERAYFLRAGRHTLLPRGRLVVFYISRPLSQAVAIARVTYSETLTKTQAMLRLTRQGVLSENEIGQQANDRNQITAFTFDNLVRFPKVIDYSRLKEMGCIGGANLVTAEKISDVALGCIVREAFGEEIR